MFAIENYAYDLPSDRIAQLPAAQRDHSRLLRLNRREGTLGHWHFFDLPDLLCPGDLLVVNNTRVVPARITGRKETGGRVEVLVLDHGGADGNGEGPRRCLLKASKPCREGTRLFFDGGVTGCVASVCGDGVVAVLFEGVPSVDRWMDEAGDMPLPPYIKRDADAVSGFADHERYQTVFSRVRGAVAAPTAGLHFTPELIQRLKARGISMADLTLHVGHGTFRPVRTRDIRDHDVGREHYRIPPETAAAVVRVRKAGGRVVAVGTTVVRALETAVGPRGEPKEGEGETNLLITPGYRFRAVDALITNFHLPKSSLLFLVAAFAGLAQIRDAYQSALMAGYRFYSYGDAMLIE